ncbi:hypothetical protein LF1_11000 [Rubripirellula obstinata]|uniref:Replication-relaxation n=1 Tax=Rubripirellula obstinata TaxID=406547 RepID=A0A5B1CBN8_9BACT|nr:replication-relaxation family protein [Rubripirellula obstinata]KAA1258578.1 hypothetical protein LF1_11000 [Rubripirellula obstinata]
MQLQPRDIDALSVLARYFLLTSRQLRSLCFADDSTGRVTRRRLTKMGHEGLVRKRRMLVVNARDGAASPVYHLTRSGREFLAAHYDDDSFLRKPIEPSQPQHLFHYIGVSDVHIMLDQALAQNEDISLTRWINEDDYVNDDENDPKKRFKLLTQLGNPGKLVCAPDSAFQIETLGHRAAFYVELDRDTYFHDRVAARKTPGYQRFFANKGHRKHFPDTTLDYFFVLFVAPTEKRARQLRDAFAKKNKGDAALEAYRFGSFETLTAENLLTAPLFRCCHHDDLVPLVKAKAATEHADNSSSSLQSSGTM